MQLSYLLMLKIISMFLMVIIGYALVHLGALNEKDTRPLNTVCLYAVMPCCILNSFLVEVTPDKVKGLIITGVAALLINGFYILFSETAGKALGMDVTERAAIAYPNAGNLIIPLVMSVLGPEEVFYTCAFMVVQSTLLFTHGVLLLGGSSDNINLKKIILNPNVIASMSGIVVFLIGIKLPSPVKDLISSMGGMIGPISMVIIGMNLASINFKSVLTEKRNYLVAVMRLIIMPLIVIGLMSVSGITRSMPLAKDALFITMLASSGPVAATVVLLADQYADDGRHASALNVLTLMFCIVTIPLMSLVYQMVC